MVHLESVIDKGAEICGSKAQLARELGVSPKRLDDWKRGRVHITPEYAAKMALIAGLDAEQTRMLAAQVMIDNPKNAETKEVLRRAFFGLILIGAVGLLLLSSNVSEASAAGADNFTVYTLCVVLGPLLALRARSQRQRQAERLRPRDPLRDLGASAPLVFSHTTG